MICKVLLLGNEQLYERSEELKKEELKQLPAIVENLHDTLIHFKQKYGAGRAIAAPQIGVKKDCYICILTNQLCLSIQTFLFLMKSKWKC